MAKSKEEATRKAHKKSKKVKSAKSTKPAKEDASDSEHIAESSNKAATTKLTRKQTELARVYHLKCALLLRGDLSYLEYQELREEICRLNALKDVLANKAAGIEIL